MILQSSFVNVDACRRPIEASGACRDVIEMPGIEGRGLDEEGEEPKNKEIFEHNNNKSELRESLKV